MSPRIHNISLSLLATLLFSCGPLCAQDAVPGVVMDSNANLLSRSPEMQEQQLWEPAQDGYSEYTGETQNTDIQPYQTQQTQPYQAPEVQPFRWSATPSGQDNFSTEFNGEQSTNQSSGGKFRSSSNRFGFNNPFTGNALNWNNYEIVSLDAPEMETWADSYLLPSVQEGAFHKITANALWAPKSGLLEFAQLGVRATFAFPLPKKTSPLLVSPGFSGWFFDKDITKSRHWLGSSLDLYSANCEIRWIKPISSQYYLEIGAAPGIHSAFKYSTAEGFRIPAHLGLIWKYNPRTKVKLGCAFLDRFDSDWLPFGGIVWAPDELEMVFELMFPNPKISKRIRWWGAAAGNDISDWLYISGELAGDCWTLKNDDGRIHSLAYRDYRVMIGYEKKTAGCVNFAVEVGGMFGRKLKSDWNSEEISPDPGVFVRLKLVH